MKTTNTTDEQLALELKQGSMQALEQLYAVYGKPMAYFFKRFTNNCNEKAFDLTQDLFVRLVQKIHLYDESKSFKSWFYSMAYNMGKNAIRNEVNRAELIQNHLGHEVQKELVLGPPENNNLYDQQLLKTSLKSALKTLNYKHRAVVILRVKEGFSIADIASILEISEGTVKSRLHYALKVLEDLLKEFK